MQRPRVICIAATLVAGASMFAPVPAAAQLFPGELRPSAEGADSAQPGQPGAGGGAGTLAGPSLYGTPPESGAGRFGFVSVGGRKLKVKVRPGYTPPGAAPVPGRATLPVAPAQLGTAAVRPPSRLGRRGLSARSVSRGGVAAPPQRASQFRRRAADRALAPDRDRSQSVRADGHSCRYILSAAGDRAHRRLGLQSPARDAGQERAGIPVLARADGAFRLGASCPQLRHPWLLSRLRLDLLSELAGLAQPARPRFPGERPFRYRQP